MGSIEKKLDYTTFTIQDMPSSDRIVTALSLVLNDTIERKKAFIYLKEKCKLTKTEFDGFWNLAHPKTEKSDEIVSVLEPDEISVNIGKGITILKPHKGIYYIIMDSDGNLTDAEILCEFDDFHIEFRFKSTDGEYHYVGYIKHEQSTIEIKSLPFKECKLLMKEFWTGNNIFDRCGLVLRTYMNKAPDQTDRLTKGYGFLNGWKFPFNSYLEIQNSVDQDFTDRLTAIFNTQFDIETLKQQFKTVYDVIGIERKDLICCSNIASFFGHEFLVHYDLNPLCALKGNNTLGKTDIQKWFARTALGHLKNILKADDIKTEGRLFQFMSVCTGPIVLDDCTNIEEKAVDNIKMVLTSESDFIRNGKGVAKQFRAIDRPIIGNIEISFNETPTWFDSNAFASRSIIHLITYCKKDEKWTEYSHNFPIGGLLYMIWKYTEKWDGDKFKSIVSSFSIPEELTTNRSRSIYRFYMLGQYLAKEACGLELNLDGLMDDIIGTHRRNDEYLLTEMEYQIQISLDPKKHVNDQVVDSWVKQDILTVNRQYLGGIATGFIWRSEAVNNLGIRIENKKWKLPDFFMRIQEIFPSAINGTVKDKDQKTLRGVWIAVAEWQQRFGG